VIHGDVVGIRILEHRNWKIPENSFGVYLMDQLKTNICEKRKYYRFQVRATVLAQFNSDSDALGTIQNVSRGGLAFHYYIDSGKRPPKLIEIDIFSANNEIYLPRIPVRVVADIKIADAIVSNFFTMRRCGVQFGKLTFSQMSRLKYFIGDCAINRQKLYPTSLMAKSI